MQNSKVVEFEKSQAGRLFSIFGFSTAMLYLASKDSLSEKDKKYLISSALFLTATVGIAYIINEKRINDVQSS